MKTTARFFITAFSLLALMTTDLQAAEKTVLYKITGTDKAGAYQIHMDFSTLPAYRLNKSDERIDLFMTDTTLDAALDELMRLDPGQALLKNQKGDTAARFTYEKWKNNLIFSFLLSQPTQQIDLTKKRLILSGPEAVNTTYKNPTRLTINLALTKKEFLTKGTSKLKEVPLRPLTLSHPKPAPKPAPKKIQRATKKPTKATESSPAPIPAQQARLRLRAARKNISSSPIQGPLPEEPQSKALKALPKPKLLKPLKDTRDRKDSTPTAKSQRTDSGPQPRPVIATKLPGATSIITGRSTAGRFISSPYAGKWEKFFSHYEVPIQFNLPLRYSFPNFPSYTLIYPKGLQGVMSAITLAQGRIGEWDEVVASLAQTDVKNMTKRQQEGLKLTHGEALAQQGNLQAATQVFKDFQTLHPKSPLSPLAGYLSILVKAASDTPYEADYALNKGFGETAPDNPLFPWFNLLKAEIFLHIGRPDTAIRHLEASRASVPKNAENIYALRKADALAQSGKDSKALELYRYIMASGNLLKKHPYSLANYAQALYRFGEYSQATEEYKALAMGLAGKKKQDLAYYAQAMSLKKSAKDKDSRPLFNTIQATFPETEGAYRARIKVADLNFLANREAENIDAAVEYGHIATGAPLRELREEAAFKQILVFYAKGELLRTTQFLQDFVYNYGFGGLRQHAEALQMEILPTAVNQLIKEQDYMQALILAEQNRDLLISGRVKADFLEKIGQAFNGLGFWNRAIRVYRYMVKVYKGRKGEDKAHLALITALHNKGDHKEMKKAAERYLKKFPKGGDRGKVFYLLVSSLHKEGQTEEAATLLKNKKYPINHELNALAGRIFWQLQELEPIEKHLAKVMDNKLSEADPDDVYIRAEALYLRGLHKKAQPLYNYLAKLEPYSDQALYRTAQIHIDSGQKDKGINILRDLTEKAISPLWRKMATETLAINQAVGF